MLVCSLLVHLAFVVLIITFRLYPEAHPLAETTYYVDLLTLPVAAPQKGTPAPVKESEPAAEKAAEPASHPAAAPPKPAPAKPAPPAPSRPAMSYPTAKAKPAPPQKQASPSTPQKQAGQGEGTAPSREEEQAFNDRIAKLERQSEERRQADAIARLRSKSGGRAGSPTGQGTQAGSDYGAYIQSRLRDAFVQTIAYETKAPQVTLRLTIGADGKVARYRVEKSSGDRVFEDAVDRAVHMAEKSFRRPPNGSSFEQGFIFKPQGVVAK